MQRDLDRGAITEIDALNGAVAAEGRRLGVPVPENELLWRQVREREGRPAPPEV
jgi:2-dehydropantoate 2-reductase